jgi:hypothetical protein
MIATLCTAKDTAKDPSLFFDASVEIDRRRFVRSSKQLREFSCLVESGQPPYYCSDLGLIADVYFGIEWLGHIAWEYLSVQDEWPFVWRHFRIEPSLERPDTAECIEPGVVAKPPNYGDANKSLTSDTPRTVQLPDLLDATLRSVYQT